MNKTWLLVGLITAASATSAMAAKDNFNRAKLGHTWVVPFGQEYIQSNTLQGTSGSLGYDKRSSGDTSVKARVTLGGTDVEYGAVASGDIASGNNAFAKIQAQTGDGQFSNAAFYVGNNGGGDFFALTSEVPSPASVALSFCGTVATMTITSSAGSQTYNYDYGTSFGTGGGLGTYGTVALDRYKSKPGGCAFAHKGVWIKRGSGAHAHDLSK